MFKVALIKNIEELSILGEELQQLALPLNTSESTRFCKGVRYCAFLEKYFDSKVNKNLFKAPSNPRILVPPKKKFDTDKAEMKSRSGYVELLHQRNVVGLKKLHHGLSVKTQNGEKHR